MKEHTRDCRILETGWCTCRFADRPSAEQEKAFEEAKRLKGTRHVDTEPRITWLGSNRLEHPRTCGVYSAPEPNWAPYCTCGIALAQNPKAQRPFVPMVDPDDVPKEYRPWRTESRAPWWVWMLFGAGGTAAIAEIMRWVNGG